MSKVIERLTEGHLNGKKFAEPDSKVNRGWRYFSDVVPIQLGIFDFKLPKIAPKYSKIKAMIPKSARPDKNSNPTFGSAWKEGHVATLVPHCTRFWRHCIVAASSD